ncbi:MAG: hypothetical protein ACE5EV_00460 [Gaiellales bacterium]
MADLIQRYLRDLERRLPVWPWRRNRILREVERHLCDLTAAEQRRGLPRGEGERRAIEQFGAAEEVAASFARSSPTYTRLVRYGVAAASAAVVIVVAGGVTALAVIGLGSGGAPQTEPAEELVVPARADGGFDGEPATPDSEAPGSTTPGAETSPGEGSVESLPVAFAPIKALRNMSIFTYRQNPALVEQQTTRPHPGSIPGEGRVLLGGVGAGGQSIVAYPLRDGAVSWELGQSGGLVSDFKAGAFAAGGLQQLIAIDRSGPFATPAAGSQEPPLLKAPAPVRASIYGIVPDEVTNVVIAMADGTNRQAVLGHNAFAAEIEVVAGAPPGPLLATGVSAILLRLRDGTTLVLPQECGWRETLPCPTPRPVPDPWAWSGDVPGTPIDRTPLAGQLARLPGQGNTPAGSPLDTETTRLVVEGGAGRPGHLAILAGRRIGGSSLCFGEVTTNGGSPFSCVAGPADGRDTLRFDGPLWFKQLEGGSRPTQVDFTTVAGLTRSDVVRVAAVLRSGEERSLRLNRYRGFAYAPTRRARFPVALRAYGETGALLTEIELSKPEPICQPGDAACDDAGKRTLAGRGAWISGVR